MQNYRTMAIHAAALALGVGLGAPGMPAAAQPGTIIGEPPVPRACRDAWRCPDPLLLDSAPLTAVDDMQPPSNGYVGNGFEKPEGQPWMAQIQRPDRMPQLTQRVLDWEDRQWCGGTVIAAGWILTAAHCLKDNGNDIQAAGYRVRLGVSNLMLGETGLSYKIVATYAPSQYNSRTGYYNDIALIRFAPDAQTARGRRIWVQKVAIDAEPPAMRKFAGTEAHFYGWGRTVRDRPSAPLLYGKVLMLADGKCARNAIALCGQGYGAAGSTQCKGDSGGPLVWWIGTKPVLIGVVSHNPEIVGCGRQTKPGVFTRVSYFKKWIEGYTGPL